MVDRKRCCCNCERNIRHEVAWISVKDRLPRCGDRVIMTDGVFVCEAFLSISGKWMRNGISWIESEITHWMPMPEPPVIEKTEE